MIRRHVLAALAAGIAAGDDDAARRALRKTDWVLRGRAKKQLETALIDAALITTELGGATDPEAARHVQRVAALTIARAPHVDVMDRERVAAAYSALPKVAPPTLPIASIVTALLAAGVLTSAALAVATSSLFAPRAKRTYERPLPPPVAGAYKTGGVPLRDEAIEKLLTGDFTTYVLELDRARRNGVTASNPVPPHPAGTELTSKSPALAKAWTEMVAMLDQWPTMPTSSMEFDQLAAELRAKVRAVSDQLAAAGIGYYLEADMFSSSDTVHAVVYSYRVEEVVFVKAATIPRRVLSLRRLDNINLAHSLLGMQSSELGDPVLLEDQIDEHVASQVFPILADGARYELAEEAWLGTEPGKTLASLAGAAVRTELDAVLGPDAAAAGKIAALLRERDELVLAWRKDLEARDMVMPSTDELFLTDTLLDSLDGYVPGTQLRRARDIDEEIAKLDGPRIASKCHQIVAATVRRHEAQHGLDDERQEPLRYPAALEEHLGEATDDKGAPRRSVDRVRAELSAYTSQLANDPSTPQFSLWNVARFAFQRTAWGTPECYSAVLIVEGLARHLNIPSDGPVIHDHEIDRTRLAKLLTPMVSMKGDQLRTAARAVWTDLYAEQIVPIVDR